MGNVLDAEASPLLDRIRRGLIGDDEVLDEPYGLRRIIYADYTVSGRALDFVEDFVRAHVLPRYANTHTESSGTGRYTTRLREQARQLIRDSVGGTDDDLVIFCGSGATAAVAKLVGILGLRLPAGLSEKYSLLDQIPRTSARWCSSARTSTIPTNCRGASPSWTSWSSASTPAVTSTSPSCVTSWSTTSAVH